MEDAATVEISRAQIWQWLHHPKGVLNDGRKVTTELFHQLVQEELDKIKATIGEPVYARRRYDSAAEILDQLITNDGFVEFLTLPAYQYLA